MRLLLIADGGPEIGAGHWLRAYALAEHAIALGHQPTLLTRNPREPRPPSCWDPAPCPVHVLPHYRELPDADLAIVDTYPQAGLLASLARIPVVAYDDAGSLIATGVRAVVNPNLGTERFAYRGMQMVYAGSQYATVRSGFRVLRRPRGGPVRHVLIGLGGTGNVSAWPRIRAALKPLRDATVLLYGARPHPLEWYAVPGCEVRPVTTHAETWAAFQFADLAIVGIGVTALECLCCGVPTIAYAASDMQRHLLPCWRSCGLPTLNREILRTDAETRHRWSVTGLAAVDGHGARRVLEAVTSSLGARPGSTPAIPR